MWVGLANRRTSIYNLAFLGLVEIQGAQLYHVVQFVGTTVVLAFSFGLSVMVMEKLSVKAGLVPKRTRARNKLSNKDALAACILDRGVTFCRRRLLQPSGVAKPIKDRCVSVISNRDDQVQIVPLIQVPCAGDTLPDVCDCGGNGSPEGTDAS